MSKWIVVSALLCVGLTAACSGGGGSGVSRSKSLASLSDDEITDLCEYLTDVEVRVIECGGDLTITIEPDTVAECVAEQQALAASCSATVGDAEDCSDDSQDLSDDEICENPLAVPASCAKVFACDINAE